MIKKITINKIYVTTISLVLLLTFYLIPSNPTFEYEKEENSKSEKIVYLMDQDSYISQVVCYFDSNNIYDEINKRLDILINGVNNEIFIPLIPKNTKVNNIKMDKSDLYLDFSKELLNISEYFEESLIESIIYSLTEINGIDNIYISINGDKLTKLPYSKKQIPYPLNRNIGINKEYDLDNLNKIDSTTVFFKKINDDYSYYIPVTKVKNIDAEKIDIIIDELKSSINSQNSLYSYVSSELKLDDYNISNDKIDLIFNDYIFNDLEKKVILEEVKYVISSSIFENYDVKEVTFGTKEDKNIVTISKK